MRFPGRTAFADWGRRARESAAQIDDPPVESGAALVRQFALPGLAGALLVSVGAVGVGWISIASGLARLPVIETIRDDPATKLGSKVLMVIGVAVLLVSWLSLGHHVRTRTITEPRRLSRLIYWWSVPLLFAPVLFSRDLFSYIAHSRLLPNGIDPYQYGTSAFPTWNTDGADALWNRAPAPYGPLWMGLSNIVYWLTHASANPALLLFRLLAFAGVVLMAIFLPRLAAACGVDEARAIWLGLLNPLVVLHFVSAGHNDALMVGLLVAGITLAMERKPWWGLLLVALAGAVKAPALVGIPFVCLAWAGPDAALLKRVKLWVVGGLVTLGTFLVLNLLTGLNFGWLSGLGTPGKVRTWLSVTTGLGMLTGNLTDLVGLGYRVDQSVAVFRAIGTVVTIVIIGYLVLTGHHRSPARGLGLSLIALVMLGPVVQPWYTLWGFAILAASGLRRVELRTIVLSITGFVVYSVANGGATVTTTYYLSDGLAVVLALVVVGGLLASSKRARAVLLEDALRAPPESKPVQTRA